MHESAKDDDVRGANTAGAVGAFRARRRRNEAPRPLGGRAFESFIKYELFGDHDGGGGGGGLSGEFIKMSSA